MKWFSNLKVAYKVLLSCLIFILLISVIAFQGIVSIRSAASGFEEFFVDRYVPTRQLNRILQDLLQIRVNMYAEFEAARDNDWKTVEERVKSSADLAKKYMEEWKAYMASKMTEEEKKLAGEWEVLTEAPREARGKFRTTLESRNFDQSKVYLAQWLDGYRKLRDKTNELINLQQREADKLKATMEATARNMVVMSFVFLGLAIFVCVIITFVLARAISGPVRKGLAFAERLAAGDFTSRIDLDQKDELGQLGKALNTAADDLERLISEILVAAQNLSQAVDQISGGNQNLSQRTSEQASSLEEIASTIEEATAAIRQNADNSDQANRLSGETMKMAEEGNRVVMDAVASINEINKSSKKIEEIISVINEIAFQTNLLALNAAVEAARAGEQGRGFAVVAGEVRNLAQRSGNAAKEIGALIKDSMDKIETGTDLANRSGDALREIVGAMKNVARLVSEIAAASQEQKQGLDQINIAVAEMDSMTQQNAALVEETASASEEMAGQAREMQSMVERFKISEATRGTVYQTKHKEVHLRAAAAAAKKVKVDAAPRKDDAGAPERRKPADERKPATDRDIKEVLKEEGFEEF